MKRLVFIILFLGSFCAAKDSVSKESNGIPLPGQLSYAGKGLSFGLGLGAIHPLSGEDKVLAAWNGIFEYFYSPYFSSGGNVWIYGGDISSHTMILFARYRVHGRFHINPHPRFSMYLSPLMWFETTDIETIHDDIVKENNSSDKPGNNNSSVTGIYENAPEQNGFAIGAELGFGYRVIGNFGITGGATLEKSFSTSALMSFSFGLAYDLRPHFSSLKENFYEVWLSFEGNFRRYLQKEWDRTARHFLFGINLAI